MGNNDHAYSNKGIWGKLVEFLLGEIKQTFQPRPAPLVKVLLKKTFRGRRLHPGYGLGALQQRESIRDT